MIYLTAKDSLILAQSQLQRAIELVSLVGFPEGTETNKEKVEYIAEVVTPYLMRTTVKNADKYLASAIDKVSNKD